MCGRFSLATNLSQIARRFEVEESQIEWNPRFNIAPTQMTFVVVEDANKRSLVPMAWGLIPHWSKDKKLGYSMINARSETVMSKPSFRESIKKRRCLIPSDGFYEWQQTSQGKLPYRFTMKDHHVFAFAGLWDSFKEDNGNEIKSFTILTTVANALSAQLHDRMPVILPRERESLWLDSSMEDPEKIQTFFKPYPAEEMSMFRVSTIVNSWKNELPDCLLPVDS